MSWQKILPNMRSSESASIDAMFSRVRERVHWEQMGNFETWLVPFISHKIFQSLQGKLNADDYYNVFLLQIVRSNNDFTSF